MTTYDINPDSVPALLEKVEKVNARAAKRGFTGRFDLAVEHVTVSQTGPDGLPHDVVYARVTITGQAPSYGGWTLLAGVDCLGDQFVIRCAPGTTDEQVDRSLLKAGQCQHCNTYRANRAKTYLVRNDETGSYLQVGSTCLKDFLGWDVSPVFLDTSSLEGMFGSANTEPGDTPEALVGVAAAVVAVHGFEPTSFSPSTRSRVMDVLYGRGKSADQERALIADHRQAGMDSAPEIIATIVERLTGESGYEANLRAVLEADFVPSRLAGLAVSAVSAYNRILERDVRKAAAPAEAVSQPVGTKGEKVTVTAKITRAETQPGYAYNTCERFILMVDADGNVFKMYTTAAWAFDVTVGDEVTITATVKKHEEYRGNTQTQLVRGKRAA